MVRSNALDEPVEAERSLERDFDVVGIIREKKLEYLQGGPLSDLGFLGFNNEEAREILDKLSDEYGLELPPTGFGGYSSEEHPVLGADFILFKIIRADPDIRQEIYRRGREAGFAIRDPDKYERPSWLTDDFLEKTFLTKAV
jgi:hypothetical protein